MTHLTPNAKAIGEFRSASARPLPLPVCWAVWIGLTAALWLIILRAIAFFAL